MTEETKKEETKETNPTQEILDEMIAIRNECFKKDGDNDLTKLSCEIEKYCKNKFGSDQNAKDIHYFAVAAFVVGNLISKDCPKVPGLCFSMNFEILKDTLVKLVHSSVLTKEQNKKEG